MPAGLQEIQQPDFRAGMFRAYSRVQIPDDGCWDIINGLLSDEGSVFKRGGSEYLSNASFTNLLPNPSFETDTTGWSVYQPVGSATLARANDVAGQSGSWEAKLTATSAGTTMGIFTPLPGPVAITVGQSLTVSAYTYAASALRQARTIIEFYNGGGSFISGANGVYAANAVGAWTATTSLTAVAPAGAATAVVYVVIQGAANGEVHYVDNVTAQIGSDQGLRFIWDGILSAGQRTLFASPSKFGTLASDDATPVVLGGSGLTYPTRPAGVAGMVFVGAAGGGAIYAGSRKATSYSTGTISLTNGSAVVTGAGTSFSANVDAGMLLRVAGAGRYYAVKSVDSNTQVTLADNYAGSTAAGQAYALTALGSMAAAPYRQSEFIAAVDKRLISGEGDRIYFSAYNDPHTWGTNDYHVLPGGAVVTGLEGAGDTLMIFTNHGVFALGNLIYPIVDQFGNPQQTLRQVSADTVLWGQAGVAGYHGGLVVPAVDDVWQLAPNGQVDNLSSAITPLYVSYVKAGYRPGGAMVYRGHYFLPILDATAAIVDVLVCRLDRPVQRWVGRRRGWLTWPWTRVAGNGANMTAWARRVNASSQNTDLLGAGRAAGRVQKCSSFFTPDSAHKNDADGSTPSLTLITRDFTTGGGNPNMVRRLRSRYELVGAGSDNPTISAYVSTGMALGSPPVWGTAVWGTAVWTEAGDSLEFEQLSGQAPEDSGRNPFSWWPNRRARYVRWKLSSSSPAASLTIRDLQMYVRQSGKVR